MALDRQSIERKDFTVSRRGYDPGEVDAHLSAVADEVATVQSEPRGGDSLASSASDHVRTIIEAAESSAAHIRREAEQDATQTRQRAEDDARKASASSAEVLERLEAARSQLDSVIESLRAGVPAGEDGRSGSADDQPTPPAAEHVAPTAPAEQTASAAAQTAPPAEPVAAPAEATSADSDAGGDDLAAATDAAPADAAEEPVAPASGPASSDAEGARLIALHMALNGTPRDEAAKYLSENYELSDRERLLDEVYASVQG